MQVPETESPSVTAGVHEVFDSFVVSVSNRLGYAAARAVLDDPGRAYNLLWIHGPSGSGKTCLLRGIRSGAGAAPVMFTAETLRDDLVSAVHGQSCTTWELQLADHVAVLVDDVDFLRRLPVTQREVGFLLRKLARQGVQVALASVVPPESFPALTVLRQEESALVTELLPPDRQALAGVVVRWLDELPEGLGPPSRQRRALVAELVRRLPPDLGRAGGRLATLAAIAELRHESLSIRLVHAA